MEREHKYSSLQDFANSNRKAIDAERLEETIQFEQIIQHYPTKELYQLGLIVNNLKVKSIKSGLYGRTLVTFARPGYSKTLVYTQKDVEKMKIPECRFGPGDNVGLFEQAERIQGGPFLSGIFHNKLYFKITVAFEYSEDIREDELENRTFCICSVTNDVTYNRYAKVLNDLEQADKDNDHPSKKILKTLFDYIKYPPGETVKNQDLNLNGEQQNAVSAALASQTVHLIHGPPGTGKTKTVCALIVEAVKKNYRVLACAGSNVAVDNIVYRIQKSKYVKPCRIGHPSRMLKTVEDFCLDSLVFKTSSQKILKELKHEYDQLKDKYIKASYKQIKKQLKTQMVEKRYEIRVQSEVAVKEVLHDSNVICCTNTGAGDKVFARELKDTIFDLVVIDYCAQAVEISCWIPILKGRRLVLAGDHLQLPPTIKSRGSTLEYTLFDRAMKECPVTSTLLTTQYRMNSSIMYWSSKQFYYGKLVADKSVKDHTISDLVGYSQVPLMFIDTSGCQMGYEMDKDEGDLMKSKNNIGYADLVKVVYRELRGHNLKPEQIGIITPYNAQVNFIKYLLQGEPVEISTVDGFQGREKYCIIISMVRSNPKKYVGFLADKRRMNVAVTRAKRLVCLIGDSETVSNDPTLKTLVYYFTENGYLRNAIDFQKDPTVRFGLGHTERNQNQPKKQKQEKYKPKKKKKQKDEPFEGGKELNDYYLDRLKEYANLQLQAQSSNQPLMPSLSKFRELYYKYLPTIQGFLASKDTVISFNDLPPEHRRTIHSICYTLDLEHETSANKKTLTVSKIIEEEEVPKVPKVESMKEENERNWQEYENKIRKNLEDLKKSEENYKNYRNLNAAYKNVVKTVAAYLKLMVEQNKKLLTVFKDQARWEAYKKAKYYKTTAPVKKKYAKEQSYEYILKELEEIIAEPKKCHFLPTKCNVVADYRISKCQFCSVFFCTEHILAYKHGCDREAQKRAQMENKKKYEESKFYHPKSNPMLKSKYDQMMKDMRDGRKPKGSK